MGSSSSKAVRKLPTSSTIPRSAHPPPPLPPPSQARSPLPPRYEASEPLDQQQNTNSSSSRSAFDYGSSSEHLYSGQDVLSNRNKGIASNEVRGGMGKVRFSGEKDDAVKQDAMDPQFMRNLGRLGQVKIHDAGEFVPAQAQRTLASRSAAAASEAESALTPTSTAPKHLHMSTLVSLLDRLKTVPPNEVDRIYTEYGMDKETMDVIRKWVNSVSVSDEDTVRVEDGEEVREMNARWVGGVKR